MGKKSKLTAQPLSISKKNIFISESLKTTHLLAASFAEKLQRGDIVFFIGELGSGKTAFIQGIVSYFGIKEYARSSSFIIASEYQIKNASENKEAGASKNKTKSCKLFHLDLYRLNSADLLNIGIEEYLDGQNIVLIEWAQRLEDLKIKPNWKIEMIYEGNFERKIIIERVK